MFDLRIDGSRAANTLETRKHATIHFVCLLCLLCSWNLLKTKRVQKQKGFKAKKLKLPKSLCNGDFRFVGILAFGRVLRWDLLVVKAHGVYLRRAYFQEHRPKRGGVVPFCSFQL